MAAQQLHNEDFKPDPSFLMSSSLYGYLVYTVFVRLIGNNDEIHDTILHAALFFFTIITVTYTRALFSDQPQLPEYVRQLPSYAILGYGFLLLLNNNILFLMNTDKASTLFYGLFLSTGAFDAFIYVYYAIKWLFSKLVH